MCVLVLYSVKLQVTQALPVENYRKCYFFSVFGTGLSRSFNVKNTVTRGCVCGCGGDGGFV